MLFNGKTSTYDYWNPKFAARACKKKTPPIFLAATLVPPESGNDAALLVAKASRTDALKKTIRYLDLNSLACDELIMSMDISIDKAKIAFQLVHNSCTAANPNGDAKIAWDRLKSK